MTSQRRGNRGSAAGALMLLALFALTLSRCAPEAKTVHCSNDAVCKDTGDFNYCVNGRCVECVTSSGCEKGERCSAGACRP